MPSLARLLALLGVISLVPVPLFTEGLPGRPQSAPTVADSYNLLLHSQSFAEQGVALNQIPQDPQQYVPRMQQSLRDYPRLLRTDPIAAKRAVYISALIRDPSFPSILVKYLGVPDVFDDCIYSCPIIFAITIQACFAGWTLPEDLDPQLGTVTDLKAEIQRVPRISLKVGSIENQVQGPILEKHRKEIEGKTEEQIIQIAGPANPSIEARLIAAFRLETLVTNSKNRIELYLLALNDFEDGSGEYKGAVYQSIYRAELARARGQ